MRNFYICVIFLYDYSYVSFFNDDKKVQKVILCREINEKLDPWSPKGSYPEIIADH